MNKRFINSVAICMGLSWLLVSGVAMASTPPETINLSSAIQSSMQVGDTQTITYTVSNNTPAVQPIVGQPTVDGQANVATSKNDTITINSGCSTSLAPNATCTITLDVTATAATPQINHMLSIVFGGSKGNTTVSISFGYSIIAPPPTPPAAPALTVSGPSAAIPTLTVGQTAVTSIFTISNAANAGAAYIDVNNIATINNPDNLNTKVSSDCPTAGTPLSAGSNCSATVTITPSVAYRNATVQVSVPYGAAANSFDDSAVSPISANSTFTINPAPNITISTPTPAIPNMTVGDSPSSYNYTITNATDAGTAYVNLAKVGIGSTTIPSQVKYVGNTNCQLSAGSSDIAALAPGDKCNIALTITPTAAASGAKVQLEVLYGPSISQTLLQVAYSPWSTFNIAANPNMRTITFKNNCTNTTIWVGISPNAPDSKLNGGSSPACRVDDDCYAGQSCLAVDANTKQCFWNVPPMDNYAVAPQQSTSISVPAAYPSNTGNSSAYHVWEATIVGRTNCTGASCQTGDCSNNGAVSATGACAVGHGFKGPVSKVNIALATDMDKYTVSLIDGVNVPISVAPDNLGVAANPFTCGTPGASTAFSGMGGCSWSFTPSSTGVSANDSNYFNFVADNGAACSTSSSCSPGQVCGMSLATVTGLTKANPKPQLTCGRQLGYWTANQVCATNSLAGDPFNCSTLAGMNAQGFTNITNYNLYACNTTGAAGAPATMPSGYDTPANNNCCGCIDWDTAGIEIPSSSYVPKCVGNNPVWTNSVLPTIFWLKDGCPSALVYPYDIKAQPYSCSKATNNVNVANYTVTFCPTGAAGNAPF